MTFVNHRDIVTANRGKYRVSIGIAVFDIPATIICEHL